MFVAFEGNDASGKSTVAALVARELDGRGRDWTLVEKKGVAAPDPRVAERLGQLRLPLWDYPKDAPVAAWGDHHWLYLQAAWFSLVDRCVVGPLLAGGSGVVVDNWYHKLLARYRVKPAFDHELAASVFTHLTQPDIVVLLDVDPKDALDRRAKFLPSEAGVFEGLDGASQESFVTYQAAVREELLRMAAGGDWLVVPTGGAGVAHVVEETVARLRERL